MKTPNRNVGALLLVLAISLLSVGKTVAAPDLLGLTYHHPAERSGDYDRLASVWLEALTEQSETDEAALMASRLAELLPWLARPTALVAPVEKLLSDGKSHPDVVDALTRVLASLYERGGRRDDAKSLRDRAGFVTRYAVVGPWGKDRGAAMDRVFAPEKSIFLDGGWEDGWQELEWRAVEARNGRLAASDHIWPDRGVMYALAQVRSSAARDVSLGVFSRRELVIWVNGEKVVDDRHSGEYLASHRQAAIRLSEGWNHILVKLDSSVSIRLRDVDGRALPDDALVLETELKQRELPETLERATSQASILTKAIDRWRARAVDGASADESPKPPLAKALEQIALANLWLADGREAEAVAAAEKAAELAGDDPWVRYHQGRVLQSAAYLPSAISKSRSKSAWEKAVEADPLFLPAQERLARGLMYDQKTAEAVARIDATLEENPGFLAGLLRLRRIFSTKRWGAEERRVLRRIAEAAPELALPSLGLARHYESLENPTKALELYRDAYEKDRSSVSLLSSMASLEENLGRNDAAESLHRERAKLEPESFDARQRLARFLARHGKSDEAVQLMRAAAEERPWDPGRLRSVARFLGANGREEASIETYRRALEANPGALSLRDWLARLDKQDPERKPGPTDTKEFWKPYDEVLEEWLSRVPKDGPLVAKSSALTVLDIGVVKVHADGSTSEYIHQAFQLLTEEAKDTLAQVRVPGEVIRLRTLTSDGKSLEPVAALGSGSYVLPGMLPGVFTEYAYRVDRADGEGAPFRHGSFFFQDFRYQQAFLLSRMVFLLDPGVDSDIVEVAMKRREPQSGVVTVERTERELENGGRVVIYEARNAGRLQTERAMPPYSEYIPSVEARPKTSWDDVGRTLRLMVSQATLSTPEIVAAARQQTEGIENPVEKAKKLYDWVHELVAKESGGRTAVRVLLEKSGDRNALFKALLDECGVPCSWAFVRQNEALATPVNWEYPSASFFPWRFLLVEPPDSEPIWVTLRFRRYPFGRIPLRFSGGRALVVGDNGIRMATLPSVDADDYGSSIDATVTLGDDTSAAVQLSVRSAALEGYMAKDRFRDIPAFQKNLILRAQANRMFPGSKISQSAFVGMDDPAEPMVIAYELVAPKLLTTSGQDYLLSPVLQPGGLVRSYGGPKARKHPYFLARQRLQRDRVRVELDGALKIHRLPKSVALAGKLLSYSLSYERDGDALIIERRLEASPGRLAPEEFPAFLELLQQADAAEQERVVLRAE